MGDSGQRGWHKEDIKAAIRKRGATLTGLALSNGLEQSAVRVCMCRPHLAAEQVVAEFLGHSPRDLWPDRYGPDGTPKHHPRARHKSSYERLSGHRQKPRGR